MTRLHLVCWTVKIFSSYSFSFFSSLAHLPLGMVEECLVIWMWPERPAAFSKTVCPFQMSWYRLCSYCEGRDLSHTSLSGVVLGNWSRSCRAQSSWICSRAVWAPWQLYRQKRLFPEEWICLTVSPAAPTGRRDAHTDQGARNQSLLVYPVIFLSLNACVWKWNPCIQYWKPQLWFELFGTFWPLRSADLASFHVAVSGIQMLIVCWIKKRAEKYLHIVSSVLI